MEVDPARFDGVLRPKLSVREAARELGISASSFARLVRSRWTMEVMADQGIP